MIVNIEPTVINNIKYVTVSQMASLTNKSDQAIYSLINKGNSKRKMKSIHIVNRVLIPLSELKDFPFTYIGRNCQDKPYHFTKENETKE